MKTMIDIDDDLLEAAAKEFGTSTKKDTVNAALRFAAERGKRAERRFSALDLWGEDITDVEIMARARH